jgi:hypothetical protein
MKNTTIWDGAGHASLGRGGSPQFSDEPPTPAMPMPMLCGCRCGCNAVQCSFLDHCVPPCGPPPGQQPRSRDQRP